MCHYIVTDAEIEKAEIDILGTNKNFNPDQKNFLRCLDSCCLQAYAGTGKTSSIVGKLHVLAQKKIWRMGRGVCVISHTNVAVNEIKNHVARHYPEIMEYPNFVGTIQEFVNQFLFIPFLSQTGLRIKQQSEVRYLEWENFPHIKKRIANHVRQLSYSGDGIVELFLGALRACFIYNNEVCSISPHSGDIEPLLSQFPRFPTKECPAAMIISAFKEVIRTQREMGKFLYIESFIDGGEYLNQRESVGMGIRRRFEFVFLDEAQDCSSTQVNILNKLFLRKEETVFQQIGDENQSISEQCWGAAQPLYLGASERVRSNLAQFVNSFKVDSGLGITASTNLDARLFLLIYKTESLSKILSTFEELLEAENIPKDGDFFAISHRHMHLKIYHTPYSEELARNKDGKTNLYFPKDSDCLHLLNKVNIKERGSQFISIIFTSLLFKHYRSAGKSWFEFKQKMREEAEGDMFRKLVVSTTAQLLGNNPIDLEELQDQLNKILGEDKILLSADTSRRFLVKELQNENSFKGRSGIVIKIGTIHSVKGQTHNATLYFSNKENRKQDIQHVVDNLHLAPLFKKLIYVAASRPKYLFVFAIEESAYQAFSAKEYFNAFDKIKI